MNLNQMMAALRLCQTETWHQLFTDGTSRQQIVFQNLIIALMVTGKLNLIISSSYMVLEPETFDNQVKLS